MVAAKHRLAAQAGVEVLQAGGNAVDAAVATAFAAGVVEPPMSGVGGGGYMSIFLQETQERIVVAFPMQAPQAASPDMWELAEGYDNELFGWRLVKDNANIYGYKSIAIPGMVAGMAAALEQFGTIGLDRAIAPAIRLAEEGFGLSWFETMWQAQDLALLNRFPATAATFLSDGYPHRLPFLTEPGAAGMLVQPELGATLRAIAEDGPSALYGGAVGEQIAAHVQQNGGILSVEDLAQYEATVHSQSVLGSYRGATVIGMRGGTGAPTVMETLNILENFDVRGSGHNSADYLHAFIESSGQAFIDRFAYMADPSRVPVPLDGLLDKEYAAAMAERIDPRRAQAERTPGDPWQYQPGNGPPNAGGSLGSSTESTTHLAAMDGTGNAVALTQTLLSAWGSRVVVPGTGVLLNNGMMWYNPEPGTSNSTEGGKKPLNNMCPIVLERDGRALAALGASGGRRIINTVAQLAINLVDFDLTIQDAVNAPRIDCSTLNPILSVRIDPAVVAELERRGHNVIVAEEAFLPRYFASPVAIQRQDAELIGAADPYYPTSTAMGY
jgi:gamma-glutamyltranspeptidase/glutathione hydrolase